MSKLTHHSVGKNPKGCYTIPVVLVKMNLHWLNKKKILCIVKANAINLWIGICSPLHGTSNIQLEKKVGHVLLCKQVIGRFVL